MQNFCMKNNRPLFIPLMKEYYQSFERGEKRIEYRIYGKRWNERTVYPNRPVVLSCGYGKRNRLSAIVDRLEVKDTNELEPEIQSAIHSLYGQGNHPIACIWVSDIQPLNE